ncbi:sigma-70 family RNA polymerase sigma factor [Streptomyces sp. NPDC048106]|uniref:sigma-70 family RNA polymerase sigma factor n=1 Tax=Streptomyces sp. NPDC048106 TaxID=3155750 RepID=UPI003455318F
MNSPTTLRPPGKHETDGALTSLRIDEVVGRISTHPPGRERDAARERAVRALIPVARRIAAKYRNTGVEDQDDLFQVACVGLVKAIDGYDPGHGHAFLSYAVPTITGELKRHFRDRTGLVRLPRAVQEAGRQVRRVRLELEQTGGGRPPTLGEIARASGLSEDAVAEALRSQDATRPGSLDAPSQGREGPLPALSEVLGDRDARIETAAERVELLDALRRFPERERRILVLRFFHDRTQQQIAAMVGISQMHVSRLLTRCLAQLRETLGHLDPSRRAEGPADPEAPAEGAGDPPARTGGHGRVRGRGSAREDVRGRERRSAGPQPRAAGPGRPEPVRRGRGACRGPSPAEPLGPALHRPDRGVGPPIVRAVRPRVTSCGGHRGARVATPARLRPGARVVRGEARGPARRPLLAPLLRTAEHVLDPDAASPRPPCHFDGHGGVAAVEDGGDTGVPGSYRV